MGKTKRDTGSASEDAFHRHYSSIWGAERWNESLYAALARPTRYAAVVNKYVPRSEFDHCLSDASFPKEELDVVAFPTVQFAPDESKASDNCVARRLDPDKTLSDCSFPSPRPARKPAAFLMTHWNLDAASVLVTRLLNVQVGESVLDLCAAPGGKSIALAQSMFPSTDANINDPSQGSPIREGCSHSNEYDKKRFVNLQRNLVEYLPKSLIEERRVLALNIDAADQYAYQKLPLHGQYDKVLVDAPCSSERHIIHAQVKAKPSGNTAQEMASWRPGSSKRLQETQVKVALTALKTLKMGGVMMYATCSIEPSENDGVIEKLGALVDKERKKAKLNFSFTVGFNCGNGDPDIEADLEKNWAEKTKHGWVVLPDHSSGGSWGPLFFAMLTKVGTK